MIKSVNDFFRYKKAFFGTVAVFESTGIYKHFTNIFGELVYVDDLNVTFIGVSSDGFFYDEIYYPMEIPNKIGSIVPKIFLEIEWKRPHLIWKDVADHGYAIIEDFDFNKEDKAAVLNDPYIPFGANKEFDFHETILQPYYMHQMDYEEPEKHKNPEHLKRLTEEVFSYLSQFPSNLSESKLQTTDTVRYLYNKDLKESDIGPYSFHFDYFPRLMYMFFTYFSKKKPIVGRELLVGKRYDFIDFSPESLISTKPRDTLKGGAFEKIQNKSLVEYDIIPIKDNMVVLMNTVNPLFVHRIERLREENEVTLVTNYVWSDPL